MYTLHLAPTKNTQLLDEHEIKNITKKKEVNSENRRNELK